MIRDRIVTETNNDILQKKLLAEPKSTLKHKQKIYVVQMKKHMKELQQWKKTSNLRRRMPFINKGKNRMPNQTTGTSTEKHSEGQINSCQTHNSHANSAFNCAHMEPKTAHLGLRPVLNVGKEITSKEAPYAMEM